MSEEVIIRTYLAEKSPGYALQITGEWGVGKTYTIKKILNEKMYYISLFDMKSADEIYSSIFYLMHRNTGKTKGLINKFKNVKFSFLGLNIPLGELLSSISNAIIRTEVINDKVIVLDDVERSSINPNVIFGVISNYLETHNCHVIILINENKKESIENYASLTEKTIGRTLKIEPNYSDAYDFFIKNYNNKTKLLEIKDNIISIFENSQCSSIRILKRILFEVNSILSIIDFKKYDKSIDDIYNGVYTFIILSIESKYNKIEKHDIIKRKSSYYYKSNSFFNKPNNNKLECDEKEGKYIELYKKNPDIDLSTTIFNDSTIIDMIFNGKYDSNDIKTSINNYINLNNNNTIPWKIIYNYMENDDETIFNAINKVKSIIDERLYYPTPHILHFISSIIYISDDIAYDFGEKGILEYFYSYIDDLYEQSKIDIIDLSNPVNFDIFYACDGYAYFSKNNKDFIEIEQYLKNKVALFRKKEMEKASQSLIHKMKNDINGFSQALLGDNNEFSNDSILNEIFISPMEFINTLIELNYRDFNTIIFIICQRYHLSNKPEIEMKWLFEVENLLSKNPIITPV